ncbi:MAG: hypothetical protein CYPHOPRED_001093 [Cyphobasidiales sp. Tagirdzhanova-0007]|nr:MAG: hypothetical protein CYPHOPRED_001093 [Cyphobasidiales sp. Tagirdzhanova-0007]
MLSRNGRSIAIIGITGNQGGSVFKALEASSKPYKITGFTRDVFKPNAKELSAKGVNMLSLNLTVGNKDNLVQACKGVDILFAMTNFWEHNDRSRETAEGKMMVDAAKEAGLQLFIYAGLPSYIKISNGKYVNVDHFDGKAEVEAYAKSVKLNTVSIQPAMYMENFGPGSPGSARRGEDGQLNYFFPQGFAKAKVSLINVVEDYGLFVQKVIENNNYPTGSTVMACSDIINGQDFLDTVSAAAHQKIGAIEVPLEIYIQGLSKAVGETTAREFGEMFATVWEYGYYGEEDPSKDQADLSRQPNTWASFVKRQDWSKY